MSIMDQARKDIQDYLYRHAASIVVVLPDGNFDPKGIKYIDQELAWELDPIVLPFVSSDPQIQARYEEMRLDGQSHEVAFSSVAKLKARRSLSLTAFQDDKFTVEGPRIVSSDFGTQVAYWRMRHAGQSHNMAEMLATRRFPGVKTDSVFNEGKFSGEAGRCGPQQLWLQQQADAAGVSTNGKWYCSGLARFPGDPKAWVGDRGDVARVAAENNMTVHGYVEQKGREVDPMPDVKLADGIIDSEVNEVLDHCPGADPEAVRDDLTQLRTGAVDPNPLHCTDYFSTDIP